MLNTWRFKSFGNPAQTMNMIAPKTAPQEITADQRPILDELVDTMAQDIHNQSSPLKKRGQHPKAHGCLYAEFIVDPSTLPDDLRESLSVGILSQAKTYPSWVRYSNLRQTNDAKGDIHGMAIKLMDVEGEQLEEASQAATQDFVLIDVPIFFLKGMEAYRDMFRAIASLKTFLRLKQEPAGLRRFFSRLATLGRTTCQFFQFLIPSIWPSRWRFRSLAILLRNTRAKKRHKPSTILSEQFWSPTPIQWGDHKVKITVKPWDMNQAEAVRFTPDYLREQLIERLTVQRQPALFDVYLQVAEPDEPAIDDPTVEWTRARTVKIATLKIPPQVFNSANQRAFSEQLSFSPWHGLTAHRPLGELNFIRRAVYREVARLRSTDNQPKIGVFGFQAGTEPTPATFSPTLLESATATEQSALTVLAPIQAEKIDTLRQRLKTLSDAIAADPSNYFGRSPQTHLARFVIFEDPDLNLKPQLLFTSNYDGALEPYLLELMQIMGDELESIWCCCELYPEEDRDDFDRFRSFIQTYRLPAQAFYVGCRGYTAQDILKSQQLRQQLEQQMTQDPSLKAEWLQMMTLTPSQPHGPPKLKFAGLVPVARKIGQWVWRLIGVNPEQNDPAEREPSTPVTEARIEQCSQGEDVPNRIQNQLTTLSVVKSNWHLFVLRNVLRLVNQVGQLSRGKLSGIGTIHFARWVIIEKGRIDPNKAFLLFESNYGDTWDGYLDDFVYLTITAMNSIWANLVYYPTNGCQDIERFKQHSKTRQFPAQIFYSAYPNLSVTNILGDRKLALAVQQVGQFLQGNYSALQQVDDHLLMNLVKRINRME